MSLAISLALVGLGFVVELGFLDGRSRLADREVLSLVTV